MTDQPNKWVQQIDKLEAQVLRLTRERDDFHSRWSAASDESKEKDSVIEVLERAVASWKREEADWKERERELLAALERFVFKPMNIPSLPGHGICRLCTKYLDSDGVGHADSCIVKPAEKLMEDPDAE